MEQKKEITQIGICPVDPEQGLAYKLEKKKNNGIVYSFYWFLGMHLAKFFKLCKFTPNFVSVLSMLFHIIAGYCFWVGTYNNNIIGGFLVFLGILMDATDGKLARMTKNTSNMGNWLDYNFDYIRYLFLYPPIALALLRRTNDPTALYFAFTAITVILCSTIIGMRWNLFPFATSFKKEYTKKSKFHVIAKQFYAIAETEPFVIIIFAVFDLMREFLIIWTVWSTVYYLGKTFMYGFKIHKEDIKSKFQKK